MTFDRQSVATTREMQLTSQYGGLLSTTDIAQVLRYGSPQAVRKARIRGALNIPMRQLPGRRGLYATARAVAAYLDQLDPSPAKPEEASIAYP